LRVKGEGLRLSAIDLSFEVYKSRGVLRLGFRVYDSGVRVNNSNIRVGHEGSRVGG
jgi:hypothetical protein